MIARVWLRATLAFGLVGILGPGNVRGAAPDKPEGALVTRWAKDVSQTLPHPEYPRPQLVRKDWVNLNGPWDYAIRARQDSKPDAYDGKILVPFPVESTLSGVKRFLDEDQYLWYHRPFKTPNLEGGKRLLLHFGAVDWQTTVWANGKQVGEHKGGYDPFTFDITEALKPGPDQVLIVQVWDPTDAGSQPRGKQVRNPGGIFYTAVSGIWQTVWLEPVSPAHVESLKITPDVDEGSVTLGIRAATGQGSATIRASLLDGPREVTSGEVTVTGDKVLGFIEPRIKLAVPEAKLWSPSSPFLYDLKVTLSMNGQTTDTLTSYFGMRKIAVAKDAAGINRLFLNSQPLFQCGPLDQGWWPDGLYLAPTDEAMRYDIETTRKLGFNMCRKHVKSEPARWYYHADQLGLMVWQDMPSGMARGKRQGIPPGAKEDASFSPEEIAQFDTELKAMIGRLQNHPSIVAWVPYNEGWGQHDTVKKLQWVKQLDPTRLVDGPSGWEDRGWGDMKDRHQYPGPGMFPVLADRASVLGEFGGLGLPLEGHLWWNKRNWGYRNLKTLDDLQVQYEQLIRRLRPLIRQGLAAAVYTQTTDCEGEVNGLMTYDRAVVKLDVAKTAALHAKLYEPVKPVARRVILPTSEEEPQTWRFTTAQPGEGWFRTDFNDADWQSGPGGFGEPSTPNTVVHTRWKTPDIWIRRTFNFDGAKLSEPQLRLHHDEDAEVYLNGKKVITVSGYATSYFDAPLSEEAARTLRPGQNVLAIHCHQTGGGQYIDAGLVDFQPKNP
jgi:Glycosyl hydrolases family 2/Glycosyl hydrolases family 2, sugar binding domain/Glycosyl hydrolases family 2, TIM barrel domain